MADFQIEYKEGYCGLDYEYCGQCHTCVADHMGCKGYKGYDGKGYGECEFALFNIKYKGMTVKKYEMEEYSDGYNPMLDCMLLTTRSGRYECRKVILDGVCIYPERGDDK